jgi:CRP/FNR family transcriptional regulator, cAMP and macrophage regulator
VTSASAWALEGRPIKTTARGKVGHAAWLAASLTEVDAHPLSESDLCALADSIRVIRLPRGSRVLAEGHHIDVVTLVRSGEVEVYWGTGPRRYVFQILRSGDFIGDVESLTGTPSPFSARARGPVVLIVLRGDVLSWLLRTRPSLSYRFLVNLAHRTRRVRQQLLDVRSRDVRTQLADLLVERTRGAAGVVNLPQSVLAQLVFGSRTTVNRVLKEFERNGTVRLGYRCVEVLDPKRLVQQGRPPRIHRRRVRSS